MSPDTIEPVKKLVYNGYINAEDGSKMSKSKGNTVDPLDIIKAGYGADALRVFELFIAPYDQDTPWNNKGVPGTYRFLNRLWVLTQEFLEQSTPDNEVNDVVLRATHKAIAKVTDDLDTLSFNTAVSAMMECVNTLYKIKQVDGFKGSESWRFALESLVQLLAPFAPHITEELWHELGHDDSVHVNHWPKFDETYLHSDTMRLAVQVNGKVRAEITVAMDATEDEVTVQALKQENVQTHLQGREPKKIIYVPNRLVSIVV
jgi:leucyl-tRNA synthetase